ncbi:P27 family phage terminase small subunit [Carnobacteriaceae bacterium zg-ZUI78]|nr:P27 family phage terminase small subunit [Carnobacteriaceae bacterium zg-ZUI78]
MTRPLTSKKVRAETIKHMKSLGTYRKEFEPIINMYSHMMFQYLLYEKQHAEMDYKVTDLYVNKAGAENERKIPILTAMETLRKDILSYSDKLMLNPKSLGEVSESDIESPLQKLFALQRGKSNETSK